MIPCTYERHLTFDGQIADEVHAFIVSSVSDIPSDEIVSDAVSRIVQTWMFEKHMISETEHVLSIRYEVSREPAINIIIRGTGVAIGITVETYKEIDNKKGEIKEKNPETSRFAKLL
jgi:hypothetical protein